MTMSCNRFMDEWQTPSDPKQSSFKISICKIFFLRSTQITVILNIRQQMYSTLSKADHI